jgi:hypothetical protein
MSTVRVTGVLCRVAPLLAGQCEQQYVTRENMLTHRLFQFLGVLLVMALPGLTLAEQPDTRSRRIYIGGGGGVGVTTTGNSSGVVLFENRVGLTAGLFAGWRVNRFFSARFEAAFSTKGAEATRDGLPFGVFYRSYAEFPLLLHVDAPLWSRITPHASLGPALGILLQAKSELADGRNIDLIDRTERIDVGLMASAGVSFDVGESSAISISARYIYGLRNYNKISANEDDEATNRAFYVTVGYQTDLSVFSGDQ